MKTTKEKTLDAVKIQREIREKISSETENMTYKELLKYIEQRVKITGTKPIGQK
jgi:hypothetical protein